MCLPYQWTNLAAGSPTGFGMACLPEADGAGRLVLAVHDDGRLERLLAELSGLPEVAGARLGDPAGPGLSRIMEAAMGA